MEKIKIVKIGGAAPGYSSGAKRFLSVIERLAGRKAIVIVSAIGKSTRILRESGRIAASGDFENARSETAKLKADYSLMAGNFPSGAEEAENIVEKRFSEIELILKGIATIRELSARIADKIMAYGEIITGELFALLLEKSGVDFAFVPAEKLILTDEQFGEAKPDYDVFAENFDRLILPELSENQIVLTQGFIAGTSKGDYSTMGFESSNYTAALIASKAEADELEVITDAPGIRRADPKIYPEAPLIEKLSYSRAKKMAESGLNLLHGDMLETAEKFGIILKYRSIDSPDEYTLISPDDGTAGPVIIDKKSGSQHETVIFGIRPETVTGIYEKHFEHLVETHTYRLPNKIAVMSLLYDESYFPELLADYPEISGG